MHSINVEIDEGELLAIVGLKGSGKSTFLRCLLKSESKDDFKRDVYINGKKLNDNDKCCKELLIDASSVEKFLVPSLSIAENIFLGNEHSSLGNLNLDKMYFEANEIFNELGIKPLKLEKKVNNLSFYDKLIVVILKNYARHSCYFIFDEITKELEKEEVIHFFHVISQLKRNKKIIFYTPYKIEEISQVADKIAVFYKWNIISGIFKKDELSYERVISLMTGQQQNFNPFTEFFLDKYRITDREKEIITFIANGYSNNDISEKMDISVGTVKNHIYNIFQKTDVKSRIELCNLIKIH